MEKGPGMMCFEGKKGPGRNGFNLDFMKPDWVLPVSLPHDWARVRPQGLLCLCFRTYSYGSFHHGAQSHCLRP